MSDQNGSEKGENQSSHWSFKNTWSVEATGEREKKCKHELFRLLLCRDNAHEVTEDVEGCGETLLFPKAFLNWQIIRMNLLFRKKLEVMMC